MLNQIVSRIIAKGGHPLAVGGWVRDKLLNLPPKDIDIEVHNMSADTLIQILSEFGKVDMVGMSFGVIKLWTEKGDFDFSLPRRDNKIGKGHKGFQVEVDPTLSIVEAASRRDFTINSMAWDLKINELVDPFNGKSDLENKVLRHTSPAFSEDPLRVLRGMQFVSRFDMEIAIETAILAQDLVDEFSTLPKERIWAEWEKWASKSIKPSKGLQFLVMTNWITLFPELENLINCPQDEEWHPEGDVWEHTKHVVNEMAEICQQNNIVGEQRILRMFGALCHDFGKPATTVQNEMSRWISPGHAQFVEPTKTFLERIGMPISMREAVIEMVQEHMVHVDFNGSERTVRRLLSRLKNTKIEDVMAVIESDHSGRPPLPKGMPHKATQILEISKSMGNEIKPILMGRHLIERQMKPGPEMGVLLKRAFEAQLDGEFDSLETAFLWLHGKI